VEINNQEEYGITERYMEALVKIWEEKMALKKCRGGW